MLLKQSNRRSLTSGEYLLCFAMTPSSQELEYPAIPGRFRWMYRILVEKMFGLKVSGHSLASDPVLPSAWETVSLRWMRGEAVYEIMVENSQRVTRGVAWIEMDGRRLVAGDVIELEDGPIKHKVHVHMGLAHA